MWQMRNKQITERRNGSMCQVCMFDLMTYRHTKDYVYLTLKKNAGAYKVRSQET